MRLPLDHFSQIKNYIHIGQAAILFLAWVLTIALLTRKGTTDGRVGWYFGLCFLTIPILIYLVMVPMWSRARRFANVYAFASIDCLAVILWLSAWASVASYVSAGKGKGTGTGSGCDNFKYGSQGRCELGETIIVFGVFEMLLFIATALISLRAVMTFKRTGMMPAEQIAGGKHGGDFSTQTQDAFSSNMRTDDDLENDGQPNAAQEYGYRKSESDSQYAPIHQIDQEDSVQPQGPLNNTGLGIQAYQGYR
ncbi:hypothetical protein LTR10_021435 [Elasticomyces elasticus]|uniref:MARVEL domain-containing protein n=1 Tax=Exophiala sideris TaxID=1016849 RepID=A0ABR0JM30_9EURO|nr:hypothetical protein LTR10_021435 [Elasticomyces elasticus]KAK5036629.1 hypothetical protein LTS07_002356 [Exophiala sideris]KAK5041540.1 hypothetical protein LTR13_002207 [Exophiala sideris]KAK5067012.1 hypothetical protein LTR69_002360 [Exophiala sideris]KAK5185071.1 hypothetical protein LTR44_002917 [Eurotiomycetes sp. CCFEE 6388]